MTLCGCYLRDPTLVSGMRRSPPAFSSTVERKRSSTSPIAFAKEIRTSVSCSVHCTNSALLRRPTTDALVQRRNVPPRPRLHNRPEQRRSWSVGGRNIPARGSANVCRLYCQVPSAPGDGHPACSPFDLGRVPSEVHAKAANHAEPQTRRRRDG